MWNEAGACHVAARPVRFGTSALHKVVAHRSVEIAVFPSFPVDGDNPFQTVARRGAEQQFGLEVFVTEQPFPQRRDVRHMVKVDAQQFRVKQQSVLAPRTECARKGAEVKVLRLVPACSVPVRDGAQRFRLRLGIRPDDVAVDVGDSNAFLAWWQECCRSQVSCRELPSAF